MKHLVDDQGAKALYDLITEETDLKLQMLAPAYSATSTYAVNDTVMHDNKLYRCIIAINVPEQWNVAHWQETTIVALIDNSIYGAINQGY